MKKENQIIFLLCMIILSLCVSTLVVGRDAYKYIDKYNEAATNYNELSFEYTTSIDKFETEFKALLNETNVILKDCNIRIDNLSTKNNYLSYKEFNNSISISYLNNTLKSCQASKLIENVFYLPTRGQLQSIVDSFNNNKKYKEDEYNCVEFSNEMITYLQDNNILSCAFHITYEDGGHMLVSVRGVDDIYYIEPQDNYIFYNYDSVVDHYSKNDKLIKLSSCYEYNLI